MNLSPWLKGRAEQGMALRGATGRQVTAGGYDDPKIPAAGDVFSSMGAGTYIKDKV